MNAKVIRYADDFIVIARSKNLLDNYINPAINEFLRIRGLSTEKTKIFTLRDPNKQLDYLGYTFKYKEKWSSQRSIIFRKGSKSGIALYPNKEKVKNFIQKLKNIYNNSLNLDAITLINKLNPIIRGWSNYYNMENSSHYRSVVRNSLYLISWRWIKRKHPTLGKKILAKIYFLTPKTDLNLDLDENLPSPFKNEEICTEFTKHKNTKWVFHGKTFQKSRYSNKNSTKTIYLIKPSDASPIITATKYILPDKLKEVHAYHKKVDDLKKFKLNLSLIASPKYPSLKEKLYHQQEGLCVECGKEINFDNLLFNTVHIHHIDPIYKGGSKADIKNLSLLHTWCHRILKH